MTAGSVMNGAGSPGQQRWIGSRVEVDVGSFVEDLLARRPGDRLGAGVRDRLQLQEAADLLAKPLRRLHVEDVAELGRGVVELLDAECHAHALLGAELVDEKRVLRSLRVLEEEGRPARLHDAVGDLGDLEIGVGLGLDPT